MDAREDHLRPGRADVDAHRQQRDVVLRSRAGSPRAARRHRTRNDHGRGRRRRRARARNPGRADGRRACGPASCRPRRPFEPAPRNIGAGRRASCYRMVSIRSQDGAAHSVRSPPHGTGLPGFRIICANRAGPSCVGEGGWGWGVSVDGRSPLGNCDPLPSPPQPAAGLPASGNLKSDQTLASQGLVWGGSGPSSGDLCASNRNMRQTGPASVRGRTMHLASLTGPGREATLRRSFFGWSHFLRKTGIHPGSSPGRLSPEHAPIPHRMDVTRDRQQDRERHGGRSLHRAARRARHRIRVRQCRHRFRPDRGGARADQGRRKPRAS